MPDGAHPVLLLVQDVFLQRPPLVLVPRVPSRHLEPLDQPVQLWAGEIRGRALVHTREQRDGVHAAGRDGRRRVVGNRVPIRGVGGGVVSPRGQVSHAGGGALSPARRARRLQLGDALYEQPRRFRVAPEQIRG